MAAEQDAAAATAIVPRSLGVMFEPPTLTLVYAVGGKLRKRTMPVRHLQADSDPSQLAQQIIAAHPTLLSPQQISAAQITRLMGKLVAHKQQQQQQPQRQGQPLDQQQQEQTAPQPRQEQEQGRQQQQSDAASAAAAVESSWPRSEPAAAAGSAGAALGDGGDLNKVSEDELKAAKAAMEVDFKKNALRPGDEGYVYDKRVERPSGELEANDWDDELEDFETDDEDDKLLAELLKEGGV